MPSQPAGYFLVQTEQGSSTVGCPGTSASILLEPTITQYARCFGGLSYTIAISTQRTGTPFSSYWSRSFKKTGRSINLRFCSGLSTNMSVLNGEGEWVGRLLINL